MKKGQTSTKLLSKSQSEMLRRNSKVTFRILITSIVFLVIFAASNIYLSRVNTLQLKAPCI